MRQQPFFLQAPVLLLQAALRLQVRQYPQEGWRLAIKSNSLRIIRLAVMRQVDP
jgi:hypothetical protein